jgi:hypothetical protein
MNDTTTIDALRVTTLDGKYTVIQSADGRLHALRYGTEWRELVGDGLILTLAQDIETLTERLKKAQELASATPELLAFARTFAMWDSKGIIKTLAPYEGNEGGLRVLARTAIEKADGRP